MQKQDLSLPGLCLLIPRRHIDDRGSLSVLEDAETFSAYGLPRMVQENLSSSHRAGTLRGLHFQRPPVAQAKLLRVLRGALLDVVLDIRHGTPTYGKFECIHLKAGDGTMLYIPEGLAHGFITLMDNTEVSYKLTRPYAPQHEGGVAFNDPDLKIDWLYPPERIIMSDRDKQWPKLSELPPIFEKAA